MAEWNDLLKDCDCCATKVNTLQEAVDEPQVRALGLVSNVEDEKYGPLTLTTFPAGFTKESIVPDGCTEEAPEIDEHREYILGFLSSSQSKLPSMFFTQKPVEGGDQGGKEEASVTQLKPQ